MGALKNFAKFAGKHLCWSIPLTVTGVRYCHVNLVKFLRKLNLQNICEQLLLKVMCIWIQ